MNGLLAGSINLDKIASHQNHNEVVPAMTEVVQAQRSADLNTPEMQRRVNALRPVDNLTNWLYLLREYAFLTSVIGLTLAFYQFRAGWGLAWQWNVPVALLAVLLIGAGQHRLT